MLFTPTSFLTLTLPGSHSDQMLMQECRGSNIYICRVYSVKRSSGILSCMCSPLLSFPSSDFLLINCPTFKSFPCQVSFTFQDPWGQSESVSLLIPRRVVAESQRHRHGPDPIIAPLLSAHYLSPTCSFFLFSPFPPLAFLWMLSPAAYALIPQLLYSKNNN